MTGPERHPYIATIERYYEGCNRADVELMKSTFTEDVVHYFVDHAAVRGDDNLAGYWSKVRPRTHAKWTVDHAIAMEDEAVIEWSMRWTPVGNDVAELLRGTEWFIFRGGKIAEIRSYHNNHYLQDPRNAELRDFPYDERGYTPSS